MAYGKGASRDLEKRLVDLGRHDLSPVLADLRSSCLAAVRQMSAQIFPARIEDSIPSGKDLDKALLAIQARIRAEGLSSVWCEKMRLLVKAAVLEQWKRGQRNLFGRLKHISSRGDKPLPDGSLRLINLPGVWTQVLSEGDVSALQSLADGLDFRAAMSLLRSLRVSDAGLAPAQAEALRAMTKTVSERFSCPQWSDEAILQLHLDDRCVRGGARSMRAAREDLTQGLPARSRARSTLSLAAPVARGEAIPVAFTLPAPVSAGFSDRDDQSITSLAVELGPQGVRLRGVVARPVLAPSPVGACVALGEDFGYTKTSSMVVVRSGAPISQEAVDFAEARPGKAAVKRYLGENISGDEVEVLESRQICGRKFLDSIRQHADAVDRLRSEIDRCYNRLARIRAEINRCAGLPLDAVVPKVPADTIVSFERSRYLRMHARFFRLLGGIGKLKAKRRAVHAKVAAVKKNWLGHVGNVKVALAEKHGAVVVSEDLTVLAIETDDPRYRGRTFNKMVNDGAKGQYIRRSLNKLKWRNIAQIQVPSFYSSSTDWRTGHVCKSQRGRTTFTALDGAQWDPDLHAGEMLARWLFLTPMRGKSTPSW